MKLSTIFRVRGFIVDIRGFLERQDFKIDRLQVKADSNEKKIDTIQVEVSNHIMTKLGEHDTALKTIDGKLDHVIQRLDGGKT